MTDMAKPGPHLPAHANASVHKRIMDDLKNMTSQEFLKTLVQSQICTQDGKLTDYYAGETESEDSGNTTR